MANKPATISSSETRLNAIPIQQSTYGVPIAVLLGGTQRIAPNLIWYGGFRAIATTSKTKSGGKGGGGVKQENTTYSYKASIMLALCEGPIDTILTVMRDKSMLTNGATTALAQAGLSLATGEIGQAPWTYLTTYHPDDALGYSQTAYVYAADYELGSGAQLQNHSFEVQSLTRVTGLPDADGAQVVTEFLTNPRYGVPLWSSLFIGDLSDFKDYSLASNLLLSPLLDQQRQASEVLSELVRACNSEVVWSEGVLKIIPLGTESVTANGVTWNPDLTPIYDLTDADYIADRGVPPVEVDVTMVDDAYNSVQVEILNRLRQYNIETIPRWDQASIEQYGERKADVEKLHCICDPDVGAIATQLILQRSCYNRRRYRFSLGIKFDRLEPMDLVTLTDGDDIVRRLVRIRKITEPVDLAMGRSFEAEDVLVGTAGAALYPSQPSLGYVSNYDSEPGDVREPVIFTPPSTLTNGALEVWAAVAGQTSAWGGCEVWVSLDDASYELAGAVSGGARYGVLSQDLAYAGDPDTTSVLSVDISASGGALDAATQTDVDAAATLCWVDGEMLAYRDATLTAPFAYDLSYLRRGVEATPAGPHLTGDPFVRIDSAVFRYSFAETQVGKTIYIKMLSFNSFGRRLQQLEDVLPYTHVLAEPTAGPERARNVRRSNATATGDIPLTWDPSARATVYKIFIYTADGEDFMRAAETSATTWTYSQTLQNEDEAVHGFQSGFLIYVVASNSAGDATATLYSTVPGAGGGGGGAGGPQPAAVTGAIASGFATTGEYNYIEVNCDVSTDPATTGYVVYSSQILGFTPTGLSEDQNTTPSVGMYKTGGTWYARIAAYNADWNGDPLTLNFSAELSAVSSDYRQNCPAPETMILMADGTEMAAGDLEAGMMVLTQDEVTLEWGTHRLEAVAHAGLSRRHRLILEDGRTLVASPAHRLHSVTRGFVELRNLVAGEALSGQVPGVVLSVSETDPGPVVRISTEGAETYQTAGLLSHNIKMGEP